MRFLILSISLRMRGRLGCRLDRDLMRMRGLLWVVVVEGVVALVAGAVEAAVVVVVVEEVDGAEDAVEETLEAIDKAECADCLFVRACRNSQILANHVAIRKPLVQARML